MIGGSPVARDCSLMAHEVLRSFSAAETSGDVQDRSVPMRVNRIESWIEEAAPIAMVVAFVALLGMLLTY